MSNTGRIKRYSHTGNYVGDIQLDNDGEFVKYDDHLVVVNPLKSYVPTANKLIFDLEKMLKSTESSLIYSSGRAEKLTRELTVAEQRISELEKQNHFLREEITLYQQCVGGAAVLLNYNDATAARNYITEFNDYMDNRLLSSNTAE